MQSTSRLSVILVLATHINLPEKANPEENAFLHSKWTNHLAVKLLCIFVLDRFSDFVSDQVVAPVREAASQTLAALLLHMPTSSIMFVHENLLQMIQQGFSKSANGVESNGGKAKGVPACVWQVRHAGLLGLKYEVAVRNDLIENEGLDVLRGVVDAAVLG
jgi:TATA-binding protein-associated factor